ncbi:hypothetical protein BDN71DRAFT_825998 [Pleurotus eryngii]|uniref:Uncharacterized protein n=1 Tax=Pleurotus eryngii TaxID=5323 RepID=A0A9P5ZXY6_PLEER|nr:hypothetical protein BDN71DRAFT_825998 [Pleurotus eryngii]
MMYPARLYPASYAARGRPKYMGQQGKLMQTERNGSTYLSLPSFFLGLEYILSPWLQNFWAYPLRSILRTSLMYPTRGSESQPHPSRSLTPVHLIETSTIRSHNLFV